ncbi:MAG: transglutaminase-like domain-containing protein [Candidatus Hodarchaeales archaeon]|jgi:transglutaminase-like putative cysteine protease
MAHSTDLDPTFVIDSDSTRIQQKAHELQSQAVDNISLCINIFNFVRDEIKYKIEMSSYSGPADFKASKTLQRKKGFCIPKSVLLVALYRACNFRSRLHFADIVNHQSPDYLVKLMGTNIFYFHGYAEVSLLGQWYKLTPSFERELCLKHDFPVCLFDGSRDATFSPKDIHDKPFIDYLKDRGVYSDLPFSEMISIFQEFYSGYL